MLKRLRTLQPLKVISKILMGSLCKANIRPNDIEN